MTNTARLVGDIGGHRTDALYVAVERSGRACTPGSRPSGARIEMALHDTDYGSRDFACRDPEGNLWSFTTGRPYWPEART